MKKSKWIIFFVVIACACLAGVFWLLRSQPNKVPNMEVIQAVPLDVLYLCYFEHVDILNETVNNPSSGWSRFVPQESPMLQFFQKLQDDASKNATASAILQSKAIYSLHPQGKNIVAPLLSIGLPSNCTPEQLEELLKTSERPLNVQAYHGTYITSLGTGDSLLYATSVNNIALFSSSLIILQNAIRHVNSGVSLNDNEQFLKVMQTSSANSDVRLFINHRALSTLLAAIGGDKLRKQSALLPYLADWTALDGQASPNIIYLNGFIFPSLSDNNYLSLLLSQNGAETTAWSTLPAETVIAFNLGLTDVAGYLKGYRSFLEKHKALAEYNTKAAALEEHIQRKGEEFFLSLYPEEVATAYISGANAGWVTMFKSANQKYVLEQMKDMATAQKMSFVVSDKKDNNLYHNPAEGLLPALFGELYSGAGDVYFTIQDNWIIFGSNIDLLASLNLNEKTTSLKKYLQATQASQYLSSSSVFSAFVVPSENNAELLSYLHPSVQKDFERGLQGDTFKMACVQMRVSGDKLYTAFLAIYDAEEKTISRQSLKKDEAPIVIEEQRSEKKSESQSNATETKASSKVKKKILVTNSASKKAEYLVQYDDNKVALTNKSGVEVWSKSIDGAIVDTAYQIDFYKNGKLQLLLATANKLYLIDRKGQVVAPYPLPLSPAAKNIALFDYDKNREYRIFISFSNNIVRSYDKKGRAVNGWNPFKAKANITRAPEFFRMGGRDFIMVCDEQATYFLDRKGNQRLNLSSAVVIKPGTAVVAQPEKVSIKVTTTKGKVVTISLKDGKIN